MDGEKYWISSQPATFYDPEKEKLMSRYDKCLISERICREEA
jgi:hypothetical protein